MNRPTASSAMVTQRATRKTPLMSAPKISARCHPYEFWSDDGEVASLMVYRATINESTSLWSVSGSREGVRVVPDLDRRRHLGPAAGAATAACPCRRPCAPSGPVGGAHRGHPSHVLEHVERVGNQSQRSHGISNNELLRNVSAGWERRRAVRGLHGPRGAMTARVSGQGLAPAERFGCRVHAHQEEEVGVNDQEGLNPGCAREPHLWC